jgi:hypothetical protein
LQDDTGCETGGVDDRASDEQGKCGPLQHSAAPQPGSEHREQRGHVDDHACIERLRAIEELLESRVARGGRLFGRDQGGKTGHGRVEGGGILRVISIRQPGERVEVDVNRATAGGAQRLADVQPGIGALAARRGQRANWSALQDRFLPIIQFRSRRRRDHVRQPRTSTHLNGVLQLELDGDPQSVSQHVTLPTFSTIASLARLGRLVGAGGDERHHCDQDRPPHRGLHGSSSRAAAVPERIRSSPRRQPRRRPVGRRAR